MRAFRQPSETFGPYDPGAPKVKPDTSTPARRVAVEVEESIRRDEMETGVFIAPDGRVLLRRQGQPDRITFLESELLQMRGATFTHNHPGGSPFSVGDIQAAAFAGLAEVRAVAPSARYIARGLGVVSEHKVQSAYEVEWSAALQDAVGQFNAEVIRRSDVSRYAQHLTWLRVAKRLGFFYAMELS